MFTTAPSNAATALLIIRSVVTGNDPYCFVTNAFAGVAEANQTTPSSWSEGTSAGATYTSELSNDAGFTTLSAVNSSVNSSIYSNNDVFAQRLGYINYADMVSKATNGQTIISGGYLRTNLIQAGAINAGMINTVGLIAENISANEITGKTINSSVINGAHIIGGTLEGTNLITLTDAGYITSFNFSYYATLTKISNTSFALNFPIYGYNYSGNGYKVRSLNNNNYAILNGPTLPTHFGFYATHLALINAPTSCTIKLTSGATTFGSYSFPYTLGRKDYTINGTTFVYYANEVSCNLGILDGLLSVDNLTSSGDLKLVVSFGGGNTTNSTGMSFSHMDR